MRTSIYSTIWGLAERPTSFDVAGALANWAVYADQISIACGDDYSLDHVAGLAQDLARRCSCLVTLTRTRFDFTTDALAYGHTENAALQACDGDLLIQQNADERFRAHPGKLTLLYEALKGNPALDAFFVPNIDLYGSVDSYLAPVKAKWTIHRQGLSRGPVSFGLKADGRPDYNRTSTDEALRPDGQLATTARLLQDNTLEGLQRYVAAGMPITYHLGYVSLADRLDRSLWWKAFWERATNGDPNQHPTSIEQLAAKATVPHGLPLWPTTKGEVLP